MYSLYTDDHSCQSGATRCQCHGNRSRLCPATCVSMFNVKGEVIVDRWSIIKIWLTRIAFLFHQHWMNWSPTFFVDYATSDVRMQPRNHENINCWDCCQLKIPSKWENFAHNGLICFFQHNYIPTFEQWLWDRVCVLSTWFGDICGSRKDFCMFYKKSRTLYFKFYSLRLLTNRPM